jgi:membrane protein required for colicin V production
VLLDVIVLVVLALAALHGATGGALKQVVQLLAAVVAWVAARHLVAPVAAGLGRWMPHLVAPLAAAAILFFGAFALVSLLGAAVLRATSISTVVRGPTDRGAGAVLGGAKGAIMVWVVLSALALGGGELPGAVKAAVDRSEYLDLAHRYNLLQRLAPEKAKLLERLLAVVREARQSGGKSTDETSKALLAEPRVRELVEAGGDLDPAQAEQVLADPRVQELLEKMRERAGK